MAKGRMAELFDEHGKSMSILGHAEVDMVRTYEL